MQTTLINQIPIRWHEQGSGVPVVLIHGIPTGPALWRNVIPRLQGSRALVFEMLGYAGSMAVDASRDISVAAQAGYVADWLRHLGIERAVLVGHDLGGGVAQIVAVRQPALCAGLLLTNAIGYDSWPIPSVKALRAAAPLVARLPGFAFRAIFSSFLRRGHDDQTIATNAIRTHWPPYDLHGAGAFVRQIKSLNVNDTLSIADSLPALRGKPARIVWGAADRFQKIKYGKRFAGDLGAPLITIPRAKHFTPEDHPDIIAAAINEVVIEVSHAEKGNSR